jgi:hypothetical protein
MAEVLITTKSAPALGDVRTLGTGDTVYMVTGWTARKDAPRYLDAVSAAVTRGADVRHVS